MATKRRDPGAGSVYQIHDHPTCPPSETVIGKNGKPKKAVPAHKCQGLWAATVDLGDEFTGRRRENGEPIYRRNRPTVKAKTKTGVVEKLKEMKRRTDTGVTVTNIPSAGKWLRRWITEIRPHQRTNSGPVRPRTLQSDRTAVERYLIPFFEGYKFSELERRPGIVLEWQKWLRKQPRERGKGNVAESTVLRAHAVGSKAWDDAIVLEGYMSRNPFKAVQRPGRGNVEIPFLDAGNAAPMLEHDPDGRWSFALLTGKRQGERLGLRWNYLDLDQGVADVAWQLQRLPYRHGCTADDGKSCGRRYGGDCPARELAVPAGFEHIQLDGALCLTRPKSHIHLIPLIPSVVDRLKRRKETVAANAHDLVWTREGGRPIELRDDWAEWYAALAELGLPAVRPHSARHTCATTLMSLGVPEAIIMQLVGHSTVLAARRYLHADIDAAREGALKLGRALGVEPPAELPAGPAD